MDFRVSHTGGNTGVSENLGSLGQGSLLRILQVLSSTFGALVF